MSGQMRPIYFNGKFYAAGLNGVHRVADRLIRELDMEPATPEEARQIMGLQRSGMPLPAFAPAAMAQAA